MSIVDNVECGRAIILNYTGKFNDDLRENAHDCATKEAEHRTNHI